MTRSGFTRLGILTGAIAGAVATMAVARKANAEIFPFAWALTPRNIVCGTAGCPSVRGTVLCATGKLTLSSSIASIEYSIPCYFADPGQTEDEM